MNTVRVASVQAAVVYNDPDANAAYAVGRLRELATQGVQLAVFPEAFLTGYCVDSAEEARRIAFPVQIEGDVLVRGPEAFETIRREAAALRMHVVFGFAARDARGVFNAAALIEPDGRARVYVKTHLPELGLDKHVVAGDSLPVFDTALGKIGILICFDLRPPEPMRVLALEGADLVVLPTNWPDGAQISAQVLSVARAVENRVAFVSCNRFAPENGTTFIGMSSIIDPLGNVLAMAGGGEEVLVADLDLDLSRQKRVATIPGQYEWTVFESRRPELYSPLVR
ncbi:MAG: carbon-nitrogen hydrolase family protein [Fimbriimonadaceae bacterium]|nr:carbon-nitrogen hydrolase family protein [Fimbriimonadaceae bacterium]